MLELNASATSLAMLTEEHQDREQSVGHEVYRGTTSGGYGDPIATLQGYVTSYVATGLQSGTSYFFVISTYDNVGNESLRSNEVSKSIF